MNQGSKEWFDARKGKITASAASAIIGCSPFEKRGDVMRRMVREYHGLPIEEKSNPALEWGKATESEAMIDLKMQEKDLIVTECGFIESARHEWLGASPDGLAGNRAIIEIKCPYSKRNEKQPKFKSIFELEHYYAQIHVQMYCTGRNLAYFYQWAPNGSSLNRVAFNREYFSKLLWQLSRFHKEYLKEIKNKDSAHLDDEVKIIHDDEALQNYEHALNEYNKSKKLLDSAKERIIKLADGRKSSIGKFNVIQVNRKGSVNYKKVVQDYVKNVDLSKYCGSSTTYWSIR